MTKKHPAPPPPLTYNGYDFCQSLSLPLRCFFGQPEAKEVLKIIIDPPYISQRWASKLFIKILAAFRYGNSENFYLSFELMYRDKNLNSAPSPRQQ